MGNGLKLFSERKIKNSLNSESRKTFSLERHISLLKKKCREDRGTAASNLLCSSKNETDVVFFRLE